MTRSGVLALQGDYAAHARALRALGHEPLEVRRTPQLDRLDGLIIPGGESTTLLNLMRDEPWFEALRRLHARGGTFLGTCAGAILLARQVVDPPQPSLGLIDVEIRRNGFGRQVDSFEAEIDLAGSSDPLRAAFIRAPRFLKIGADVEVLGRLSGEEAEPVLLRQGRVLAATFHTELADDLRLHEIFIQTTVESSKTNERESRRAAPGARPDGAATRERRVRC